MPAKHLKEITEPMMAAALAVWQSGMVRIDWMGADPSDAIKQVRRANVLLDAVSPDDVWRILGNESLTGKSGAEELDWAIALACEPPGMLVIGLVEREGTE